MSRWSIDVLFSTHASQHASFPSIPLNRHNGHETTFVLLAYWEGAALSSLISVNSFKPSQWP